MPTHRPINPRRDLQLIRNPEEIAGDTCANHASEPRQDVQDRIYPKPDTKKVKFGIHESHQTLSELNM